MLLAGTGVESTQATIELTKEAADRGVDAVLVKNPFYFKSQMTFDVYMAHYTAVADASPVPVIIYNVPVFTGVPLQSELVIELAKHPNIRGHERQFRRREIDFGGGLEYRSSEISCPRRGGGDAVSGDGCRRARWNCCYGMCRTQGQRSRLYRAFAAGDYKKAGAHSKNHCSGSRRGYGKIRNCGTEGCNGTGRVSARIAKTAAASTEDRNNGRSAQIFRRMNSELAELS